MTRFTHYAEAFWGSEFTSTAGFDALSKHNSEQKKFLRDLDDFFKSRSKIELEYSKALGKLGESVKERSSLGSLERTWNTLRMELEVCKNVHENAGLMFAQQSEETRRFCKDVTTRRDTAEDRLKKIQNQKQQQHRTTMSLQKTYVQKCRDKDICKENFSVMRRGVTSTVKELEKAKTKWEKSEEDAARADANYKAAVTQLEDTRQEWEREMEQACKDFQTTDEEQMVFMRGELWSAVNKISETCVETDDSCERMRQVLEKCDIDQDIQSFIKNNATGIERPGPVFYQNYYDSGNSNSLAGSRTMSADQLVRPPLPSPPFINNSNSGVYSYATAEIIDNDPTYAAVDPNYATVDDSGVRLLTVIKSFQTPDFSVSPGEKVVLVRKTSSNTVQVKTMNQKLGVLPLNCIKEPI